MDLSLRITGAYSLPVEELDVREHELSEGIFDEHPTLHDAGMQSVTRANTDQFNFRTSQRWGILLMSLVDQQLPYRLMTLCGCLLPSVMVETSSAHRSEVLGMKWQYRCVKSVR